VGRLVVTMQEDGEDPSTSDIGELLKRTLQSGQSGARGRPLP